MNTNEGENRVQETEVYSEGKQPAEETLRFELGESEEVITLRESFTPFLNRTLENGAILNWKRADLSHVGEVVTYKDGEFEDEHEITESAGQGYISIYTQSDKKVAICDVFEIAQDLKGKGLGRKLWEQRMEPKAREYGVGEIQATHVVAHATGFWKRMGFSPVGGDDNSRRWSKSLSSQTDP